MVGNLARDRPMIQPRA